MKTKYPVLKTLVVTCALGAALGASAQPNLVLNGDFSSGGANWNNNANAAYYYFENASVLTNIVSFGWSDGGSLWQNTTAPIQAATSYELAVRAQVGQSPVTGLNLSLQDVTTGWTWIANQDFTFASQSKGADQWETFTLDIPASALTSLVGDSIGVGVRLNEVPSTQQGWVWMDLVSLQAMPVPEPSTLALLGLGALAAVAARRRRNP